VSLVWQVEELPNIGELKPSAVFALQRVLLEAITNALKHSGARLLRVAARARDPDVEISIEDDGCGFDPLQCPAGLGLANMRARAQRIGARIRIHTSPGRGTDVTISIPRGAAAAA
jgi:signal transduction histidine kinase